MVIKQHWFRMYASVGLSMALFACAPQEPAIVQPTEPAPAGSPRQATQALPLRIARIAERLPALPAEADVPARLERIAAEQQRVVGLLVPLTGPGAEVGTALRDAALMALFDAYDPRLEIQIFDTKGSVEGAEAAAKSAMDAGADLLLGPLFADGIRAVAPLADEQGLPLIGFSNDDRVAGDGVYLLSFPPEEQVSRVVRFAARNGDRDFGALIPETLYGDRVLTALGLTIWQTGGRLTSVQAYPNQREALHEPVRRLADFERRRSAHEAEIAFLDLLGDDDFAAEIKQDLASRDTLGRLRLDAVLLPEGQPLIGSLAPLLPFYDIDPGKTQFLGTGLWDGAQLGTELALRGAWYAAPDPDRVNAFMARYEELYGAIPPRLATLGYDAMALVAALSRSYAERPFARHLMEDPQGFIGIDGLFRFRSSGVVERSLAIIEVRKDDVRVIDPAASNFFALD